jgi:hypothetical protein
MIIPLGRTAPCTRESLAMGFECQECGHRWKYIKECEQCGMKQSTTRVTERLSGNTFVERYYCDVCIKPLLPVLPVQSPES